MPMIDVQTLLLVSTLILGLLGGLFLVSWSQDRSASALAHWGASFLLAMPSVVLIALRGQIPDWASLTLANTTLMLAYGLFLSGILAFEGRPRSLRYAPLGAAVWLSLAAIPGFLDSFSLRVFAVAAMSAIVFGFAAWSLWRGRRIDPLPSRAFTVVTLAAMSTTQVARAVLAITHPVSARFVAVSQSWMATVAVIMLLQTILVGYLFLALAKEQAALRLARDAETDHLTEALTRRAFTERADRRLAEAPDRGALLFFDLDHFKTINDTHGHAVGDRILVAFARLVRAHGGPDDIFGRWGGEEFVLFLAEADFAAAHRTAEAIRRAFAALDLAEGHRRIEATVSAGIGLPALTGPDLAALVACADAGLYAAKSAGRDRVEPGRPLVDAA